MRRTAWLPIACGLVLGLASTKARAANGTLDLAWDSCTGPLAKSEQGAITYELFASVLGIDMPVRAYQVNIFYSDANANVPDAWRFDPPGCQGNATSPPLFWIRHDALTKACPTFSDTAAWVGIESVSLSTQSDPYPATIMRVLMALACRSGIPSPDPGIRYMLARYAINHRFSVDGAGVPGETCGGFETPMCFRVGLASFIDMDANEQWFGRGAWQVTFNSSAETLCFFSPAKAATWGAIKGQYHR